MSTRPIPAQPRRVRSFVLRSGRLTDAQRLALEKLLPEFGVPAGEYPLDFGSLFGREAPTVLEIGFGNGESTWRMALTQPDCNFLGVEVHPPGVGRLLIALAEHGLSNVRVAMQDAVELLQTRIAPASLAGVRIWFPDPWPKLRHHKRRIVQPEFVALLASRVHAGGVLHLATDWQPYAEHMLEVLHASGAWRNLSPSGDYCPQPAWRPVTKYQRRGESLDQPARDLLFERTA